MASIVVALGGGGARGSAHIGVLRALEAAGYHIRAIAGTSAGGLVAALYASGYSPDEIEQMYIDVDQSKLYGRRAGEGPGILGLAGVEKWIDGMVGDRKFDDLRLPCAMTAVDLKCACEVTLQTGSVKDAMMSTIAIPGIFPPFSLDDHELVDGGVLNPVPVSLARALKPNLPIVAVALSAPVAPLEAYHLPVSLPSVIPNQIIERITRNRVTQSFNIFLRSMDIGSRIITELRLQADAPDIIIRPDVDHISLLDRVDVHEVAVLGEEAAEIVLPKLKHITALSTRLRRRFLGEKK